MSYFLKKKNRTKLYAIILIAAIGGGLFMFYGEDMIGYASGLFTFDNEDGVAGQCAVDASLGAYDANGEIIEIKSLQSGFFIGGQEVSKVVFSIKLTISGSNIDWNTLSFAGSTLMVYPNGETPVDVGDTMKTKNEFDTIDNDQRSGVVEFTIWDEDLMTDQSGDDDAIYLEEALGNPVETLIDGEEVFLLQMVYEITATAKDTKNQIIEAGANVLGTWELQTAPDGTLDIVVDGGGEVVVDDGNLDPAIVDKITDPEITNDTDKVVDNDVQPDLTVYPKDSAMLA